jgi:hypothetical protein
MKSIAGMAGALLCAALLAPSLADAKGSGGHSGSHAVGHSSGHGSTHANPHSGGSRASGHSSNHAGTRSSDSNSKAVPGIHRDSHGRIARGAKAKDEFKKSHPCPSTGRSSGACPGYVIDHVKPLKRGGADAPSNMQWQTKEAAKQKDRTE